MSTTTDTIITSSLRSTTASQACMDNATLEAYRALATDYNNRVSTGWYTTLVDNGAEYVTLPFGLVGSFVTLSVLLWRSKDLNGTVFAYFKILTVTQLIDKLAVIPTRAWVKNFYGPDSFYNHNYFVAFYDVNIDTSIEKATLFYGDVLTLAMSVDQAIALWFPMKYAHWLKNNWNCLIGANVLAFLCSLTQTPQFYRNYVAVDSNGRYVRGGKTPFGNSMESVSVLAVGDAIWTTVQIMILGFSCAVISGLFRSKKRRDRMKQSMATPGDGEDALTIMIHRRKLRQENAKYKREKQICVSLLALAIPLACEGVLSLPSAILSKYVLIDQSVAEQTLCYEKAVKYLNLRLVQAGLNALAGLFMRFAHDTTFVFSFFLYHTFRKAFLQTYCGCIPQCQTVGTGQSTVHPLSAPYTVNN